MKYLITPIIFAGLFVSIASGQNHAEKVPLELDRFVNSQEGGAADNPDQLISENTAPVYLKRKNERKGATEVSLDYSRQFLTNGRGTWDEASLGVIHKFSRRRVVYASYSETKRFERRDRKAMIGYYQPLDEKWTLLVEASASPTHRILPKWSGMAQIERSFGNGWIGQAGYRRTEHNSAQVNVARIGVEKYWGLNRAAYALSINNLEDTGTSSSHLIQYNRYYGGESSSIGVSFAAGREIENTGPNTVIQSDIYNISFNGKHAVSRSWAFAYGFTQHRQGDLYSRRGLKLGLRFKF